MSLLVDTLVDDVLIQLILTLPVPDVLSIRKTCKRLSYLTKLRTIWCTKFHTEVVRRKLPIPGSYLPFTDLPTADLEWKTLRALQLENKWRRISRHTALTSVLPVSEPVEKVILLPGGYHTLTVHTDRIVRCWMSPGIITNVVRDLELPDRIAVASLAESQTILTILSATADGVCTELGRSTLIGGNLAGLLGDYILLSDITSASLVNWQTGDTLKLQVPLDAGEYLTFALFQDFIVILWSQALAIFPLPSASTKTVSGSMEYKQSFAFHQPVQQPISMTNCLPRTLPSTSPFQLPGPEGLPCLSVISSSPVQNAWGAQSGITRSVLFPIDNNNTFSLSSIPMALDFEECSEICIGPSGRGVWIDNGNLRPCTPRTMVSGLGELQVVDFDDGCRPLCRVPSKDNGPLCLDFDDGMGRIAIAHGKEVKIIDLV
ncbi:unnamed protein product [Somion occarium]|uniref:F-box domain-containing protein n=1 Tax=Somion occarium TaxID=3059160 RepID=A0ABP1DVD5_9APHY